MGSTQISLPKPWYGNFPEQVQWTIASLEDQFPGLTTRWVKGRRTKLGDYRPKHSKDHRSHITLNIDLKPYVALLVWIHELAHHLVWEEYKQKAAPHGKEWKKAFKKLYLELFKDYFPQDWQIALAKYFVNPSASTFSHKSLRHFYVVQDEENADLPLLIEIPDGAAFNFRDRTFRKEKKLRSYVLCSEISSGKKYRIRANCRVDLSPI